MFRLEGDGECIDTEMSNVRNVDLKITGGFSLRRFNGMEKKKGPGLGARYCILNPFSSFHAL